MKDIPVDTRGYVEAWEVSHVDLGGGGSWEPHPLHVQPRFAVWVGSSVAAIRMWIACSCEEV